MLSSHDQVRQWRAGLQEKQATAVVTGTFDILQPGNLAALEQAAGVAGAVLVILSPDTTGCHSLEQRAAFLAGVRSVDCVTTCSLEDVSKLVCEWGIHFAVHCGERADAYDRAAAEGAESLHEIDYVPGGSTADLVDAIQSGTTPLSCTVDAPPAAVVSDTGRVTVNGCFDLLHLGHVDLLTRARAMGESLTVLINSDASVQRYKGPTRPVMPQNVRARALRALTAVDDVIVFDADTPLSALESIEPDVHVKGGSYEPDRVASEKALLESWGGRLEMCPLLESFSTSRLIEMARGAG
jgi:rfaE bifunctional protein nucleotidyltransferase chain/domain